MAEYGYNTVSERDMDILFMGAISTDKGFLKLFLDEIGVSGDNTMVESVELSKTETKLGESDITVIINTDGRRIGLLIEDKIDAIEMDSQQARYIKRGEVAKKRGDYEEFYDFIVCSNKYYEINDEAKKYSHVIYYEKCRDYLLSSDNSMALIWKQQLDQAIEKAKRPSKVILNEYQNKFFRKYLEFQKANYPRLKCVTKETSNGWWAHYNTDFKKIFIYHKITEGHVEMIFSNGVEKIGIVKDIADQLRTYGLSSVTAVDAGKSAALRIEVPKINTQIENAFDNIEENILKECFDAIIMLDNVVSLISKVKMVIEDN